MTVEELINRLKETPGDYEVKIESIQFDDGQVDVTGAIIDTQLQIVIIRTT